MTCVCGCGHDAVHGELLPGHDQKLRIRLERSVGGIRRLEELVGAATAFRDGNLTVEQYARMTQRIMPREAPNAERA